MNKELEEALTRLQNHLEKDFDGDNYVKGGNAEKDIAIIKSFLEKDTDLPAPPKNCHFSYYIEIHKICEKCDKHETCARFKALKKEYDDAVYAIYSEPYASGRYNGD